MSDKNHTEEFRRALSEGAWLLSRNHPDEALQKLLPLYAAAPTNADVALNVGGAYILLHKWSKAVSVLSKAAELHPDNAMIWSNLGAAHLGQIELSGPRQQERAIRAYTRALAVNPKTPNVHYHLGLIYKERADFVGAAAFFASALEIDPSDKDAQYWLNWLQRQNALPAPAAATSNDLSGDRQDTPSPSNGDVA